MKLILILLLLSTVHAYETEQVHHFLNTSVHEGNATKLGFTSVNDVSNAQLGVPLTFATVENDSLDSYPATGFAAQSDFIYVPVLIDNRAVCFIIVDDSGKAVSLGYKQLAAELNKVEEIFDVALESITLYSSHQISSYLFSIPTQSRSDEPNLTILQPGWDRSRSTSLSTEADVIAQVKMGRR